MWRTLFFTLGLFVALLGATCFFVESVTLKAAEKPADGWRGVVARVRNTVGSPERKTIEPPEWAAFSLISLGAVTMLYAVALPRRHPAE